MGSNKIVKELRRDKHFTNYAIVPVKYILSLCHYRKLLICIKLLCSIKCRYRWLGCLMKLRHYGSVVIISSYVPLRMLQIGNYKGIKSKSQSILNYHISD